MLSNQYSQYDFNGFYGGVAGHPVGGHLGYLGHPGFAGHLGHRAGFLASHEFNAIAAEQQQKLHDAQVMAYQNAAKAQAEAYATSVKAQADAYSVSVLAAQEAEEKKAEVAAQAATSHFESLKKQHLDHLEAVKQSNINAIPHEFSSHLHLGASYPGAAYPDAAYPGTIGAAYHNSSLEGGFLGAGYGGFGHGHHFAFHGHHGMPACPSWKVVSQKEESASADARQEGASTSVLPAPLLSLHRVNYGFDGFGHGYGPAFHGRPGQSLHYAARLAATRGAARTAQVESATVAEPARPKRSASPAQIYRKVVSVQKGD